MCYFVKIENFFTHKFHFYLQFGNLITIYLNIKNYYADYDAQ